MNHRKITTAALALGAAVAVTALLVLASAYAEIGASILDALAGAKL